VKGQPNTHGAQIRNAALDINEQFSRLASITGLRFERINAGAQPEDGTGDLMYLALQKIVDNLSCLADAWTPPQ
jgi:hypothetical protein